MLCIRFEKQTDLRRGQKWREIIKALCDESVTICLDSELLFRLLPVQCYVVNRKAQTTFIGGTYNKQTFDIKFLS